LEQRVPVPHRRFLKQNLSDAAAVARPPDAGVVEAAPVPFRVGRLVGRNLERAWELGRAAAPVVQVGEVRRGGEHFAVTLLGAAEAEALELLERLLEDEELQPFRQPFGEMQREALQRVAPEHQQ